MEPWKLTDEEIKALRGKRGYVRNYVDPLDRAIATAAGKKARKDLAERLMVQWNQYPYSKVEEAYPEILKWLKGQGL